jgi:NAD+ kinase
LGAALKKKGLEVRPVKDLEKSDAVITLGGDGTILRVAGDAARAGIPVFGVNVGRLGFMTAVGINRVYSVLDDWLKGGWPVGERLMLEVQLPGMKKSYLALNDAVLRIGSVTRVTRISAAIEHEDLGLFTGDGVIVATPTGSTAYSMSAHGPVVHPEVEALILTPICAHSFSQRPVVFPAGDTLELRVEDHRKGNDVQLCLDGQRVIPLKSGDVVRITGADRRLKLFQDPKLNYFGMLREKLLWGAR